MKNEKLDTKFLFGKLVTSQLIIGSNLQHYKLLVNNTKNLLKHNNNLFKMFSSTSFSFLKKDLDFNLNLKDLNLKDLKFSLGETHIFNNFFKNLPNIDIPMNSSYEAIEAWEDSMSEKFVNQDFYDYLYKKFIWDYHLILRDNGLVPNVDFNSVAFIFSKSEMEYKYDFKDDSKNKLDFLVKNEKILYIKFISFNEIENLIEYFVNAYKLGKFDDLSNHLEDLTSDIGNDILEVTEKKIKKDFVDDIYLNVVYIEGLLEILPEKGKYINFNHDEKDQYITLNSGIGKRYYSTKVSNSFYSNCRNYFQNYTINTLILPENSIKMYRSNKKILGTKLNSFYNFSTEVKKRNSVMWKNNIKSIYFDREDFNKENFLKNIKSRFIINNTYSVLVKVQIKNIEGVSIYCMLDEQFGVYYTKSLDFDSILSNRFDTLKDRLDFSMGKYDGVEVNLVQVMYIVNNSFPKLRLKNIYNVKLDKNIINIKQTKLKFSNKFLPLSISEIHYGRLLNFVTDKSGLFVSYMHDTDLIEKIREQYEKKSQIFQEFSVNTRFYHYVIKDNEYYIVVKDIDENKSTKDVYNKHGHIILSNVIDIKIGTDSFIREISGSKFQFENNNIKSKQFKVKLPILKIKPSRYIGMANPKIGTFDIETYKDKDGVSKVYALGFTTLEKVNSDVISMYYLGSEGKTSDDIIIKCINDMLSVGNRDHIYYTHNLGGFDIIFVLATLRRVNDEKGFNYYIVDTILRDSKVLKAVIRVKTPSGYSKISFIDSYSLLTDNLDNLSKSFGSKTKKGILPYDFIRHNTLNYFGDTPSIEYYKIKNKVIDLDEYKELYKNDWCLKKETLKYLERDLRSLLEIMDSFNSYIYIEYGIQITECLTISRLALNIFLKKYYKNTSLPVINNLSVFTSIKQAYYGGIVEVYKPWGRNLIYYDVNSLYPFVAKNAMPGHECEYVESDTELDLSTLFGFFYCKVKANDGYLGLLPVHKNGLIMPTGEWCGWYFSEELKFAKDNGYEITVLKGYTFNKVYNVFDKYVDDLFKIKAESEGSIRLITKYLLNSLLGRFGMTITKLISEMVSMDKYAEILSTKPVNSAVSLSDNDMLVSYSNTISKKITQEHGLDYIEILNNKSNIDIEKVHSFDDVAISISAAITAYARIYMTKVKLDIINKGGQIYYSDTDSILTDCELANDLVGKELGQFKLEYKLKQAYFNSAKTYCLVLEDEYITTKNKGVIIKSKGVFENSLSLTHFETMYFNQKNIEAIKSDTKSNYKEGFVNIDTKTVTLNFDAYSKREKIYNNEGLWVNTKPLVLK